MSKRWRVLIVAGCGVLGLAVYLWCTASRRVIDFAGADQIGVGMTEEEVAGLLSVPAGEHQTAPLSFRQQWQVKGLREAVQHGGAKRGAAVNVSKAWIDDYGAVCVGFGRDGRVVEAAYTDIRAWPASIQPLERFWRWLGL